MNHKLLGLTFDGFNPINPLFDAVADLQQIVQEAILIKPLLQTKKIPEPNVSMVSAIKIGDIRLSMRRDLQGCQWVPGLSSCGGKF